MGDAVTFAAARLDSWSARTSLCCDRRWNQGEAWVVWGLECVMLIRKQLADLTSHSPTIPKPCGLRQL
jgi:hypothetical protein